jgi:hypothetical protein
LSAAALGAQNVRPSTRRDQKVEALILDHSDVALIVRPMLNSLLAGKMQGIFANLNQIRRKV